MTDVNDRFKLSGLILPCLKLVGLVNVFLLNCLQKWQLGVCILSSACLLPPMRILTAFRGMKCKSKYSEVLCIPPVRYMQLTTQTSFQNCTKVMCVSKWSQPVHTCIAFFLQGECSMVVSAPSENHLKRALNKLHTNVLLNVLPRTQD